MLSKVSSGRVASLFVLASLAASRGTSLERDNETDTRANNTAACARKSSLPLTSTLYTKRTTLHLPSGILSDVASRFHSAIPMILLHVTFCDCIDEDVMAEQERCAGRYYYFDIGTEEEQKDAKLCKERADLGDAAAQYRMAMNYVSRGGVMPNKKEAVRYCKLAADQGLAQAQCDLAKFYQDGTAVKDDVEAIRYFRLAAAQNHAEALYMLRGCYLAGTGTEEDPFEAFDCCQQAAALGYLKATTELARMHWFGCGTEVNEKKALTLYVDAAGKGHALAQRCLGFFYLKGLGGLEINAEEAVKWFKLGAEQDDGYAHYYLAYCYENGVGVKESYVKSREHYKLAWENGAPVPKEKRPQSVGRF